MEGKSLLSLFRKKKEGQRQSHRRLVCFRGGGRRGGVGWDAMWVPQLCGDGLAHSQDKQAPPARKTHTLHPYSLITATSNQGEREGEELEFSKGTRERGQERRIKE